MRLSNQTVAKLKLPARKADAIFWDDKLLGFGVRLRAGGKRTWILQYRFERGGQRLQSRDTLGKVGVMSADQAREKASSILARVQLGADPRAEETTDRQRGKVTLASASQKYLDRAKASVRPRTYAETERYLMKHWAPLKDVPLHIIDRASVALRLSEIHDTNGPIAANRARGTLSTFFQWAMGEGMADSNPVIGTNKIKERPRGHVLSDEHLVAIWNACGDDDLGRIVRLLILTGQRRNEVAGIRESELDRDRALWVLPSERVKNRRGHEVPLSDTALEILSEPGARRHNGDLLFGGRAGQFSGWDKAKKRLDERSGVTGWVLHDLRRTIATRLGDPLGIAPHVVEALLNHQSGSKRGVAGTYNKAVYAKEKRQAVEMWATHVLALVAGKKNNIVALARA